MTSPDAFELSAEWFHEAVIFELICGDLPAWYRRALLRGELAIMSNADAEELFERVTGRLDDCDPLITLMQGT